MCLGSFKFWKKRQKEPSSHPRPYPVPQTASPEPNVASSTVIASAPSQSSLDLVRSRKTKLQEKLWNQAYNELQEKEPDLVKAYEGLLSSRPGYQDNPQIIAMSPQEKWDQMRKTAEDGLNRTQRSGDVQEKINSFFDMATPVKGMIDRIMPVVPQAQVPWLAVSLTFEIFSKPFREPGINRTGLLYVTTKIQEYMSLSDYIVDDGGLQSDIHHKLERDTVDLYRKLLSYQMKSIYCFHKHELKRFVRNAFQVDDWSGQLKDIKAIEALVWGDVEKFQNQVMVDHLRKQSSDAQHCFDALKEISLGIHRRIQEQQEMSYEKDNKSCRQHLKQTDPSLDRERILSAKGTLLRESYSWVIDHSKFQDWKRNPSHRRLWIRGDAGKGKTMLLCGIIEELEKDPFSRLCYFFCQATDENLRDGICVLRGLLFHLIKQYPWLISHVRKDYDDSGEKLFNDHNAWQALQKIFKSVLNDEGLDEVIIIVDALDECMVHREELLQFICDISASSRAKLIVSSRPFITIQKALQDDGTSSSTLALELNDKLISDAVKRFINSRVRDLEKKRPYQNDHDICEKVTKHLADNAESTFLWVALVCKELSSRTVCRKEHVYAILKNSPPGLNNLYDRMLESIRSESRDFAICWEILATSSVVKRPVTVAELICILDPKIASEIDTQELEQIIMS
jgi:archaellum biogenesis ATPase FlaH